MKRLLDYLKGLVEHWRFDWIKNDQVVVWFFGKEESFHNVNRVEYSIFDRSLALYEDDRLIGSVNNVEAFYCGDEVEVEPV